MKIYFSNIGQNNFLNIRRVNQSIARQLVNSNSLQSAKDEPKDIVSITPQGKAYSIIANLIKQKMNITENKNSLISDTLEKGGTLDSIQSQLKVYEEQLKNIDGQISYVMAKEIENQAEKMKLKYDKKPETKDEIQTERLASIISLSGDLEQAKTVSSVKRGVDGESRILKMEIEMDKAYAELSKGALKAKVENKEAKLADMGQRSLRLASEAGDKLAAIFEKATDEPQEVTPETENESADGKQASKIINENASENTANDDNADHNQTDLIDHL